MSGFYQQTSYTLNITNTTTAGNFEVNFDEIQVLKFKVVGIIIIIN